MNSLRKYRVPILIFSDFLFINLSFLFSFIIRFDLNFPKGLFKESIYMMIFINFIYISLFYFFKMYKTLWTNASIDEVMRGLSSSLAACLISIGTNYLFKEPIPMIIVLVSVVFICFTCIGFRLSYRVFRRIAMRNSYRKCESKKRILIIGAGSCGRIVIDEMIKNNQMDMKPICIVDDDKNKIGKFFMGIKVVGSTKEITKVVEEFNIETVIIAISKISSSSKKRIIEECQKTKAKIKIIPGVYEIMDGKISISKIRDVDLKDLLGRDEVKLDKEYISSYLKDKVVLVTGGGGSIGSELCRQIAEFSPKKLLILDIYENNAYDIQNELSYKFKDLELKTIIASVRDKSRIRDVFREHRPDVIFHAAAHKHVPLMEDNFSEAIKNNVVGTLNVAEIAGEFNAKKFVLISTDKAVNPTNIMGASKRVCEMIIQSINKKSSTDFVAVRFGNVLGSNGSVIPLFKRQIKNGGPVTITHKDIIRYFMLIPEAAQLVLQAGAFAKGGEIFVLDMGEPVKIYDLAKKLIKFSGFEPEKDIKIEITGLRPGEKLYEELLMDSSLNKTKNEKIFIETTENYDYKILKNQIIELLNIAISNDKELLKKKLKEIVKTFKDPKDVNEKGKFKKIS
nr:nucleoside-diphosphate sugar epimerase/dehydratase [Clostridium chrysemydis]